MTNSTQTTKGHDHAYRSDIGEWWCWTCDQNTDYCDQDATETSSTMRAAYEAASALEDLSEVLDGETAEHLGEPIHTADLVVAHLSEARRIAEEDDHHSAPLLRIAEEQAAEALRLLESVRGLLRHLDAQGLTEF